MKTFYKKFSFWILVLLIIIVGFLAYKKYLTPVVVNGVSVVRQDIEVTVTATSTGVVKSEVEVSITAQRMGNIEKLYVDAGDVVKAGSLIAELEKSDARVSLKRSEANIKKAEVDLSNTRTEFERKKALFTEGLVTQQQYDNVQKRLSIAEAELERAKSVLETSRLQYKYSFIKTPVSGVVAERLLDVGDTATSGVMIASIVDPDKLYISAPIDEADIGKVSLDQTVQITMDAYYGKTFIGKVIKISPIVIGSRQEAKTFEVRISLPEDEIVLKPGMSADVEIVIGNAANTLVVPSQTVIDRGTEKIVYVSEGGKVKKRKVETGLYNWNFIEIKAGLKEGEKVIIAPDTPGFAEGVRVKIIDSP